MASQIRIPSSQNWMTPAASLRSMKRFLYSTPRFHPKRKRPMAWIWLSLKIGMAMESQTDLPSLSLKTFVPPNFYRTGNRPRYERDPNGDRWLDIHLGWGFWV